MATAVQSVSTATAGAFSTAATFTIQKPTGTVDGDLLILFVAMDTNGGTFTPPSGFTLEREDTGTVSLPHSAVYSKIASGEPTSWSFGTASAGSQKGYICLRISPKNENTPVGSSAVAGVLNAASPSVANSIVLGMANSFVCLFFASESTGASPSGSGYGIANNNPAWTEQADIASGTFLLTCATGFTTSAGTGNSSYAITSGGATTADTQGIQIGINPGDGATITDAITMSDVLSVNQSHKGTVTDAITMADQVAADKETGWTKPSKPSTNWNYPAKP